MEDDDDREAVKKCGRYMESYVSSLLDKKVIIFIKKYPNNAETYWKVISANGDDFIICLNYENSSLRTVQKIGKKRCKLEDQFMKYIFEVMGNGTPRMPYVGPWPS